MIILFPGWTIAQADSGRDIEEVRNLFRAYAGSLAVDLSFQRFEAELEQLPGLYAPPGGRLLLARAGTELPPSLRRTPRAAAPRARGPRLLVARLHAYERPKRHRGREAENLGQERSRGVLVACVDDGVIQFGGHGSST